MRKEFLTTFAVATISALHYGCAHQTSTSEKVGGRSATAESAPVPVALPDRSNSLTDPLNAYYREKAELDAAVLSRQSSRIKEFIVSHPNSAWIPSALYQRDGLAFEEAKSKKTRQAFIQYIEEYPSSGWKPQADYLLKYGNLK